MPTVEQMRADPNRFCGINEISRFFDVQPYTVRVWLKAGKMNPIKHGNRWKVRYSDMLEYSRELYGD